MTRKMPITEESTYWDWARGGLEGTRTAGHTRRAAGARIPGVLGTLLSAVPPKYGGWYTGA